MNELYILYFLKIYNINNRDSCKIFLTFLKQEVRKIQGCEPYLSKESDYYLIAS